MKLDVLAIGAHPDDIELSCSGTVIKLVRSGKRVGVLDLTEGELGTRGSRELRREEAGNAASVLGVVVRENLGLPDGNIVVNKENITLLIAAIRRFRPEILLFPFGQDRHPDHVHAHSLCKEAWFYSGLTRIETSENGVLQAAHRPARYYQYMQWQDFNPTFIVDVTDSWKQRMESILAFRSQFHDPASPDPPTALSSPDFFDFIETRAKYYGDRIGVGFGEAFYSEKIPGVADLYTLL